MRRASILLVSIAIVGLGLFAVQRWTRSDLPRVDGTINLYLFDPPDLAKRRQAIGPLGPEVSPQLRAALTRESAFRPIPAPGFSDWLTWKKEPGQTFAQFLSSPRPHLTPGRSVLYLQPVGSFDSPTAPSLPFLARFAAAFFALPTRVQPAMDLSSTHLTTQESAPGQRQYLTGDLLKLLSRRMPDDAFCRLGVTMADLYTGPDSNFVFGQATLNRRVGIFSFARYTRPAPNEPAAATELALRRAAKVLAHETCHMFGMYHCTYYSCLMNGSNHLGELDGVPLHLCPVCLRKLQAEVRFDLAKRDHDLRDLAREAGFADEASWLDGELQALP
jgi:archaemetzincin